MDDQLLNQISKDIVDSVLPAAQEDLAKMEQAHVQNAVVSDKTSPSEMSPDRRPTPPPSPVSMVEDHFEVKKLTPDTVEKTSNTGQEQSADNKADLTQVDQATHLR
nr:unnamed protein product [Haemonchus contortus]